LITFILLNGVLCVLKHKKYLYRLTVIAWKIFRRKESFEMT